jgi:ATP-dependent Clp protease ATP-binding subunit ClpC
MFEKYTEKARRVIFFARYEASQFGSPYIETEHVLLGILREDKALVNRIFKSLGAIETIRSEIETNAAIREKVSTAVDLPLSNENKRVLRHAEAEAKKLAHQHIAPGHLLLGLMREEKCSAAKLLSAPKVQLEQVREAVRHLSAEKNVPPQQPDRPSGPLSEFGINITLQAQDGTLPPLIGREQEVQRVIQVLSRLTGNNPLLVGEPGVGKKTIVYGLAQRIAECAIPSLEGRSIVSLDPAVIESGIQSRARFEQDLEKTLDELLYNSPGPIFFIDGLHSLAQAERFLSVATVLKPALLGGSVQCISTARAADQSKTIEAARWLDQCFTVIEVKPPDEAEAIDVLRGVKERFQQFHDVTYTDEAIQYAVFHSNSYFPNRSLPEKAIDLIDEAGARVKLRQSKLPEEIQEAQKGARFLRQRHDRSLDNNEFEKARFYADELKKASENIEALLKKHALHEQAIATVTRDDIRTDHRGENRIPDRPASQVESCQRIGSREAKMTCSRSRPLGTCSVTLL